MQDREFTLIMATLKNLQVGQDRMASRMDSLETAFDKTQDELQVNTIKMTQMIESIADSIPDRNYNGHRQAHMDMVAALKSRQEFWGAVTREVVKWGMIGALTFIVAAIFDRLKM